MGAVASKIIQPNPPYPLPETGRGALVPFLSPCRGEKGPGDERGPMSKPAILGQKVDPQKIHLAKELRHAMTPEEAILWAQLRGNRLAGLHFRRQQIIAGFIVDFYCHAASLVVEVDGEIHDRQVEEDTARDKILTDNGVRVLRFKNNEIRESLDDVLKTILTACEEYRA